MSWHHSYFHRRTLVLIATLLSFMTAHCLAAPTPLYETETDPDFVLRLPFRVLKPVGNVEIALQGSKTIRLVLAANTLALVDSLGGKPRQLAASPIQLQTENTLYLLRRGKLLRVWLNGHAVMEAKNLAGVAKNLVVTDPSGRLKLGEPRYQPTEEIYLSDDFMTTPEAPSHWQIVSGTWHVAGTGTPKDAADPFKMVGFSAHGGVAVNTDSRWFWNDYQLDASVRRMDLAAKCGLIFGYRDPQNYYGFSWEPNGDLALWKYAAGKFQTLRRKRLPVKVGQWYRLSVSTYGSQIAAYIDGAEVIQASDSGLYGGQIGLFSVGDEGCEFDDVNVRSTESTSLLPEQIESSDSSWQDRTFATDKFMEAWGSAASDWVPASSGAQYDYRGYFFRTLDLRIAAKTIDATNYSRLKEIQLTSGEAADKNGYRVAIAGKQLTLYRGAATAGSGVIPAESDLRIQVTPSAVTVTAGDAKVLFYKESAPPSGARRLSLLFNGQVMPADVAGSVQVQSSHALEYRFDAAPVDWSVESGLWQSTTRWACVPNWNFFGGHGEPVATVWNKRGFGGDQWIDTFVSPREGTSDWIHFAFPVNLNIAFAATGEQLGSGYNLVFRTYDKSTLLYRAGKVVAESKTMELPNWRGEPMTVYEKMTETWQHLQILRQGGRIRVWVEIPGPDGHNYPHTLLLDYTDPQPLNGNRMALWTWGINGMSVARLRVAADELSAPGIKPVEIPVAVPGRVAGTTINTASVNPINGGDFRTDLLRGQWPAQAPAVIKFNYKPSGNLGLALYAMVAGQLLRADFLGEVRDDRDAVDMGKVQITKAADGTYAASFALRQALRAFYPTGELPPVEQLFLGNLSSEPEQVGGLAVNAKGASIALTSIEALLDLKTPLTNDLFTAALLRNSSDYPRKLTLRNEQIDPADLRVKVNGQPLTWGRPELSWNAPDRVITIDPSAAGIETKDGEKARLEISHPLAKDAYRDETVFRRAQDKQTPTTPSIYAVGIPDRIDTFENSLGNWRRMGGEKGATLWRDSIAAEGKNSLRLFHRGIAGPFAAIAWDKPFDVRRWPVLTFQYRMGPAIKTTLFLEIGGRNFEVVFSDNDNTFPVVGSIANCRQDNQWHEAQVDLLGAARSAGAGTVITKIYFADSGITNNVQDIYWNLDNFQFVPALPADAVLQWKSSDASGIAGYSYVLDNAPLTVPDETLEPGTPQAAVGSGATYLHVRARDNAGNWSAVSHFRFAPLVTAAPTGTVSAEPKSAAAPVFEITLPPGAADVESLRLSVTGNGRTETYKVGMPGSPLAFDAATGLTRWADSSWTRDAKPYSLEIQLTAAGLDGKPLVERKWQLAVDPAQDKTAPLAPYASYIPANRLVRYDFEGTVPEDATGSDYGTRRAAWVYPDAGYPATGERSARSVNLEMGDFFSTFMRHSTYSASQFPRFEFDYRFQVPGSEMALRPRRNPRRPTVLPQRSPYNLNLVAIVNGEMQIIKFAGGVSRYGVFNDNTIGEIPNVLADGEWHHASVDFGAMLRKRYPKTPRFTVDYVGTWSTGPYGYENPQGASMWMDNVTFFSPESDKASFEWNAPPDDNGIRGYSTVLDQNAETVPAEKINEPRRRREFSGLKPGVWYFHLRACDNAGNWGPATHIKFDLAAKGEK